MDRAQASRIAHGEVRLDPLDHHGIFNRDRQKYSHKLRLIKRVVSFSC